MFKPLSKVLRCTGSWTSLAFVSCWGLLMGLSLSTTAGEVPFSTGSMPIDSWSAIFETAVAAGAMDCRTELFATFACPTRNSFPDCSELLRVGNEGESAGEMGCIDGSSDGARDKEVEGERSG